MLQPLLPHHADNAYRGQKLALWLFALLILMKSIVSLNSIFNGYMVANSADGIPLDTFTPAGTRTVVSLFAILGLSRLMLCLLGILVLVRYRTMIPLMFALFVLEHLGGTLILQLKPLATTGTPPGVTVKFILLAVIVVGLVLSLWSRRRAQEGTANFSGRVRVEDLRSNP